MSNTEFPNTEVPNTGVQYTENPKVENIDNSENTIFRAIEPKEESLLQPKPEDISVQVSFKNYDGIAFIKPSTANWAVKNIDSNTVVIFWSKTSKRKFNLDSHCEKLIENAHFKFTIELCHGIFGDHIIYCRKGSVIFMNANEVALRNGRFLGSIQKVTSLAYPQLDYKKAMRLLGLLYLDNVAINPEKIASVFLNKNFQTTITFYNTDYQVSIDITPEDLSKRIKEFEEEKEYLCL